MSLWPPSQLAFVPESWGFSSLWQAPEDIPPKIASRVSSGNRLPALQHEDVSKKSVGNRKESHRLVCFLEDSTH